MTTKSSLSVQVLHPDPHFRIQQEGAVQEQMKEAIQAFRDAEAILQGHFRFGRGANEMHGKTYVLGRRLFNLPYRSKAITQGLLRSIPSSVRDLIEIVAGPQTAGIIMARDLADFLSTERELGKPNVEAMFLDKDFDGGYVIHESDKPRLLTVDDQSREVRPRRVLIVDDVRNLNATFVACYHAITEAGGEVIATAELIDRNATVHFKGLPVSLPNYYVVQLPTETLYPRQSCPQCRDGIPITQF